NEDLETRLRAFSETALEFCRVVEGSVATDPIQLLRSLERALPALHQRLLELPTLKLGERDEDIPDPSDDERTAVYQTLKKTLGKYDTYRTVFDSQNLEEEAIH